MVIFWVKILAVFGILAMVFGLKNRFSKERKESEQS